MQLTEGEYYDFLLEYTQGYGGAYMYLKWSAQGIDL